MNKPSRGPVALIILDGWGVSETCVGNALCEARTPHLDALFKDYPHTSLGASGMDVGLPEGQMGNSEVGHLNIGAGRIVYQDFTRISKAIRDGDFFENETLLAAMKKIREARGKLHLLGLLSDGGVHSHETHLYALVELARRQGIERVCVHAFMDGRDTPPTSGAEYLKRLETKLGEIGLGAVATVTGRYYAMDRDNRWERVERAYRALTEGVGIQVDSCREAIEGAYEAGQNDEFIEPRVIMRDGAPVGTVDDGDGIVFFNFRSDRAREITRTFTDDSFQGFVRAKYPRLSSYVCMTEYDETFGLPVAFPPSTYPNLLGEIVSRAGMKQLRIAETEKYAHVTFFFNGGNETPYPGEERILIPSPQDVATYDQKPEMSAPEVTDQVVLQVKSGLFGLIVLNYANPDMVGHTGVIEAAAKAMETVDVCVGRVVEAVIEAGGSLLITADHGNCEQMLDDAGKVQTAHSANPVPLVFVDPRRRNVRLRPGILADLAPTILDLMGLEKPEEMTGRSLIEA